MFVAMLLISAVYGPVFLVVAALGSAALLSRRARAAIRRHIIGD